MRTFSIRGILTLMITVVTTATAFECDAANKDFVMHLKVQDKLTHRGLSCRYLLIERIDSTDNFVSNGSSGKYGELTLKFKERPVSGRFFMQVVVGDYIEKKDGNEINFEFKINDDYPTIMHEIKVSEDAKSPYDAPPIRIGRLRYNGKKVKTLDDFTVTATKVMFYHKGDTLVYNAEAFVLAEGSMLDALLKQMPGVELKSNGEITVNGRRIDRLLLNGKDLFNGRNELMLENLGAYTVKDIAVYDKRGRLGELVGRDTGDEKRVMDVRLKRKYNTGFLANAGGGYGTRSKYLARLFGMWFSDNVSLSAYASANNLSDSHRPGKDDQAWSFGSTGEGVKATHMAGVTYNAQGFADKWEMKGDAGVERTVRTTRTERKTDNYMESGDIREYGWSGTKWREWKATTTHTLFTKLGEWGNLEIRPRYTHRRGDNSSLSASAALHSDSDAGDLTEEFARELAGGSSTMPKGMINSSLRDGSLTYRRNSGDLSATANIRLNRGTNPNALVLYAASGISKDNDEATDLYHVAYGEGSGTPPFREDYLTLRPKRNLYAEANASFTQFIDRYGLMLPIKYNFSYTRDRGSEDVNRIPDEDKAFRNHMETRDADMLLDEALSYGSETIKREHLVSFGIKANKNLIPQTGFYLHGNLNLSLSFSERLINISSTYQPQEAYRKDIIPNLRLNLNFGKIKKNSNIQNTILFSYRTIPVNIRHLVTIPNRNPLYQVLGNEYLKNPVEWHLQYFQNRNGGSRLNHILFVSATYTNKPIQSWLIIDPATGKNTYSYMNFKDWVYAQGNYTLFHNFGRNRRFSLNLFAGMDFQSYMSFQTSRLNRFGLTGDVNISWQKSGYRVGIFTKATMNRYVYTHLSENNFTSCQFKYGADAVMNLPKNWSVSTELNIYTRTGYTYRELNTTDFVWNARVSKSILKGKLQFSLECYDILRQLSNISYSVNAQSRTESVTNFIPNYFLLHLQWKLK